MANKNRYYRRSKISEAKFRQVVKCFALDLTATVCAELTGLSVRTANNLYLKLRRRIAEYCEGLETPITGVVEIDEPYFGPRRVRGKRGRGAYEKTIVFGILKRNYRVYTQIIPDCTRATLRKAIQGKVGNQTVIHSDGLKSYDGLVDLGYAQHYIIYHGQNHFAEGVHHINGIERFWSYAKRRLAKFNGVHKRTFYLRLKETEFRFNHRAENIYLSVLRLLKTKPLCFLRPKYNCRAGERHRNRARPGFSYAF